MKRSIITSVLLLAPVFALASGGGSLPLEEADIDLADKESLQRGAEYFVDHCMGCHSLKYMRYNRMGEDLGLDEVQVRQNFIFDKETKPGDPMVSTMRPEDGEKWFGTAIPDLTLVTRWRSPDWVFTYLKSFYVDESRPYGVNNAVFPDVGMPHVLANHQGLQKAVYAEAEGEHHGPLQGFEPIKSDSLSPEEYDRMVHDLLVQSDSLSAKEYDRIVRDLLVQSDSLSAEEYDRIVRDLSVQSDSLSAEEYHRMLRDLLVQSDSLSAEEYDRMLRDLWVHLLAKKYDRMVRDLTNFLTYAGEPVKLERRQLGIYVLLFLGVLFVLAYLLKKEYWKDVH